MLVADMMFSLIRSEICGTPAAGLDKDQLTEDVCKELYILSKKHDLAHIVASALQKLGAMKQDKVSESFQKQLMLSLYRDGQRQYALQLAAKTLEDANLSHILLKGSVVQHYYPQTWMRTSCDIDILIRREDEAPLENALCDAGFVRLPDGSLHDIHFMAPNKVLVEMHHTLTQGERFSSSNKVLETVWESGCEPEEGCRYHMKPEWFILYHLVHMGRHLLSGGCGVRPFIDLWLINQKLDFDTETLTALLQKTGLTALYEVSSALGEVWMQQRSHMEETARLESYILTGGVYGSVTNMASVKAARDVSKRRFFAEVMFLPRKNLEVLYPELKEHPARLPYYQVRRWFRIFDKTKRKKLQSMMNARDAVSSDTADNVKTLLENLGLGK